VPYQCVIPFAAKLPYSVLEVHAHFGQKPAEIGHSSCAAPARIGHEKDAFGDRKTIVL
jgi:hypothetical protein